MRISPYQQIVTLLTNQLKLEVSTPERLLSPILFAATLLLCFSFSLSRLPTGFEVPLIVGETILTSFFALQICFARIFDPDTNDKVYDLMRTYPISPTAWFLSKYLSVLAMGTTILVPTLLISHFFHENDGVTILDLTFISITFLTLMGLAALGVLLALVTMSSTAKEILFPLLYFPLTAPVLLAAIESGRSHLSGNIPFVELAQSWLGLLVIFDIIYFTLGILLFGEIIKAD